jgi:hypothetical protein
MLTSTTMTNIVIFSRTVNIKTTALPSRDLVDRQPYCRFPPGTSPSTNPETIR